MQGDIIGLDGTGAFDSQLQQDGKVEMPDVVATFKADGAGSDRASNGEDSRMNVRDTYLGVNKNVKHSCDQETQTKLFAYTLSYPLPWETNL